MILVILVGMAGLGWPVTGSQWLDAGRGRVLLWLLRPGRRTSRLRPGGGRLRVVSLAITERRTATDLAHRVKRRR